MGNTSVGNVATSGTITAGTVTYPNTDGTAGQVLKTNGSGVLSWVDPANGPQGDIGPQGPQGDIGPQGPQGDIGPQGEIGPAGADGTNGTDGTAGADGAPGPQGDIGPQGPQGEPGLGWEPGKTFVINHPTKSDSYLVHACLEGPEAGVYYRGEAKIEDNKSVTIQLPDYVSSFASNFTIQITPIYSDDADENIVYSTSRVKNNSFSVRGKNGSFYWIVYGQRGTIVVEPKKAEVQVFGDGPYKYIKHAKN